MIKAREVMLGQMWRLTKSFADDREGATAVEYGLLIGLMALAIFASVGAVGSPVQAHFEAAENSFPD